MKLFNSCTRITLVLTLALIVASVSACQPAAGPTPTPDAEQAEIKAPVNDQVASIDALPLEQSLAPVRLVIPDIEIDVPVVPMGWNVVTLTGNDMVTEWVVPEDAAGWHVNSAGAGGAGVTMISGHQAQGSRVFAPLALGEVEEGQEVHLSDEDGLTFLYRVVEVSEPLAVGSGTAEEAEKVASYVTPDGTARLVLITGWPDFTTTHRVFAVAEYNGLLK